MAFISDRAWECVTPRLAGDHLDAGMHVARLERDVVPRSEQRIKVGFALDLEPGRNHADDRIIAGAERNLCPDDARIGTESPLPEAAANDHHGRCAGNVLLPEEIAAQYGVDAEDTEEIRGYHFRAEVLGLPATREVIVLPPVCGHAVKAVALGLPVHEVRVRHRHTGEIGRAFPDLHQAFGIAVRQRLQEHAVDHAEDRCVGADAERQGNHRDSGEGRIRCQSANGVTNILRESRHPVSLIGKCPPRH